MTEKRILTVIPARGGSRRLPDKNWAKLGGVSLVDLALDAAEYAGLCEYANVVRVCSDDRRLAEKHGPLFLQEPAEIAGDHGDISQVAKYVLEAMECAYGWQFDIVVTLLPTVPVRPAGLIRMMLNEKRLQGARSALSVIPAVPWMWRVHGECAWNEWSPEPYIRSQDFEGAWLQEFNAVQISDRDVVLEGKRWDLPLLQCELPSWASIDIDDMEDLEAARMLWRAVSHRSISKLETHLVRKIGRIKTRSVKSGGCEKGSEDVEI